MIDTDDMGEHVRRSKNRSLAERIDYLFSTVRSPNGSEFTFEQVAEAINQHGEVKLTPVYISQLRRGQRANPTVGVLEALAWYFGVSPAYFFDDELRERLEAELDLIVAMRDNNVRGIATRAAGLSPKSLRAILAIIEQARDIEGLPPGEDIDMNRSNPIRNSNEE